MNNIIPLLYVLEQMLMNLSGHGIENVAPTSHSHLGPVGAELDEEEEDIYVQGNCHMRDTHAEVEEAEYSLAVAHFGPNPPTVSAESPDPETDMALAVLLEPDVNVLDFRKSEFVVIHLAQNVEKEEEVRSSLVTEFILLGFQGSQYLRTFLFCLLLVVYYGTICGNLLIITLVSSSKNLHTPMYFFISQLSMSDILLTTDIVPNMLHGLLNNGVTITFSGCFIQFYFFCSLEIFECFLLTVMSYDRYVAICNPLHYTSIMTSAHCMRLIATCWLLGFSAAFVDVLMTLMLNFCGPNIIDHFFCDLVPLIEIACSGTYSVQLEIDLLSIPTVITPPIMIVLSYVQIVSVILRIPSSTGRQKAFSTCSSHLIVVSIFYCTLFTVYIVPTREQTLTISKILSLLYTVFTPLINPIIYSLRNKDIKKAVSLK
ncbi:olfactory receptor 6N1-like [Bufo gargarizans]|uniref:olfactory receptor 6N1-like n=1 Tax=Bufo gargarizans TaxID=30331 RepID=UPI001CF28360|nr:olfactory receptor 6N1-like [Bufo gargarizans]